MNRPRLRVLERRICCHTESGAGGHCSSAMLRLLPQTGGGPGHMGRQDQCPLQPPGDSSHISVLHEHPGNGCAAGAQLREHRAHRRHHRPLCVTTHFHHIVNTRLTLSHSVCQSTFLTLRDGEGLRPERCPGSMAWAAGAVLPSPPECPLWASLSSCARCGAGLEGG